MSIQSTRTIKNTETIRKKIEECLDLMKKSELHLKDEFVSNLKTNLEDDLGEDFVTFETLRNVKTFWNKHSESIT